TTAGIAIGGIGRSPLDKRATIHRPWRLQTVARPQGTRFKRRDQLVSETVAADSLESNTWTQASEQAPLRRDHRCDDLVAKALTQDRAQLSNCISEAHLNSRSPGPIFAGKQVRFGASQTGAAAFLHE